MIMTDDELRNYQAELIDEILKTKNITALNTVSRILKRYKPIEKRVSKPKQAPKKAIAYRSPTTPCCYTTEEVRNIILNEMELYQKGEFIIDKQSQRITFKWTASTFKDRAELINFESQLKPQFQNAIDTLNYNMKAGRKEIPFADLLDNNIRYVHLNKRCKLFYMIESNNSIIFIAIQNGIAHQ